MTETAFINRSLDLDTALNRLKKINDYWPNRARVKGEEIDYELDYDESVPDFPTHLIPFYSHPDFQKQEHEKKEKLISWSWLAYNKGTNDGEELVANPAFLLMTKGYFPGTNNEEIIKGSLQAMIDEHYHTYLHTQSSLLTIRRRGLYENITLPEAYSSRMLKQEQNKHSEKWKKDLLTILFATVSEVSINAHLNLIADCENVQTINRTISAIHNHDESAHAGVCIQAAKFMYSAMSKPQQSFFLQSLPAALQTYISGDNLTWEALLKGLGFNCIETMLGDTSGRKIIRDYSGLKRLCDELEITDKIDFNFSD